MQQQNAKFVKNLIKFVSTFYYIFKYLIVTVVTAATADQWRIVKMSLQYAKTSLQF